MIEKAIASNLICFFDTKVAEKFADKFDVNRNCLESWH